MQIQTCCLFINSRAINTIMTNILYEEHNTSLMFHKLFPNPKLRQELEARGYEFKMGEGLKLQRAFFGSQHRGKSAPKRQRMIQSLVILKDGMFFRKIPKASWVMLIDPSDKDSLTFGEAFMRKLLKSEIQKTEARMQRYLDTKKQK